MTKPSKRNGPKDQKILWNLGEALTWIQSYDYNRLCAIWDYTETEAVSCGLLHSTYAVKHEDQASCLASRRDDKFELPAIEQIKRSVQRGELRVSALRYDAGPNEWVPVPKSELAHLEIRLTGDPLVPILWSQSSSAPVYKLPRFSSSEIIRLWPAAGVKTAVMDRALLRHLERISSKVEPLTKDQARDRCLEEVPGAFVRAFERAWAQLDPEMKRGRGKHGRRRA
jgi:hypothetical protein